MDPDPATENQRWWIGQRAEAQRLRDQAAAADTTRPTWTAPHRTGRRNHPCRDAREGAPGPARRGGTAPPAAVRMPPTCPAARSTRRTVGKTYTAPDGKTFRPSMFVTLTCPTYGRVGQDGTPPTRPATTTPRRRGTRWRFAALFDRFIQNLRRYLGYDVQYFAAVEPQRRLAPHIHIAMRGTISRAELRRVLAATYHQVWWPDHHGQLLRASSCPSGTSSGTGTSIRTPGKSCPPGMRPWTPSAPRTSHGMWPGSGNGSTPRACSPAPRMPPGASAT